MHRNAPSLLRRAVVGAAAIALVGPAAPARAADGFDILLECAQTGVLAGDYSAAELTAALESMPTDMREYYAHCIDQIHAAQARLALGSAGGGASNPGASGSRFAPSASAPTAGAAPGAPTAVSGAGTASGSASAGSGSADPQGSGGPGEAGATGATDGGQPGGVTANAFGAELARQEAAAGAGAAPVMLVGGRLMNLGHPRQPAIARTIAEIPPPALGAGGAMLALAGAPLLWSRRRRAAALTDDA